MVALFAVIGGFPQAFKIAFEAASTMALYSGVVRQQVNFDGLPEHGVGNSPGATTRKVDDERKR